MTELKALGYNSRMKYNGEVIAENIAEENVVLVRKNHQLVIKLNDKNKPQNKEKDVPINQLKSSLNPFCYFS